MVLIVYLQYRYASSIVLWMSGAKTLTKDQAPKLFRSVENLCVGAGLPMPHLRLVESMATNAFSTGLHPQNSFLVVTKGLLELLDKTELEAIIAQELAQIGNYDTRLKTVITAVVATLWLPLFIPKVIFSFLFRIHWLVGGGCLIWFALPFFIMIALGIDAALDLMIPNSLLGGVLFLAIMIFPIYVFFIAPVLGLLILNAVSREREFLADADACLLTRHPDDLARALTKMDAGDNAKIKVNSATAHLYVLNPLGKNDSFLSRITASQPPTKERIEILARMSQMITPRMLRESEEAGKRFGSIVAPPLPTTPEKAEPADPNLFRL
jgi:heat shock protein HtpX